MIVGAGLSGIGAAARISRDLPGTTYAVLEGRQQLGGTWDLFRYPGVRSDSDMHTLGFRNRPWTGRQAIADGASILAYLQDVARESGVDARIRYSHRVTGASFDIGRAVWTVVADTSDGPVTLTCRYLFSCSGYYDYDHTYSPDLPGIADFGGPVIHPQHWPADLDVAGRRVVVVGSGATAVTLVPALAGTAAHVTMLQRSPTWIAALPREDPLAAGLRRILPDTLARKVLRAKNIVLMIGNYQLSRRRPEVMKRLLRKGVKAQLPAGYDIDTHFTPTYDPWDQRLCVAPDGDLFRAIRNGRADVVTGTIATFTTRGVTLTSGAQLEADVVVTATGLRLLPFGGVRLEVDGEPVDVPEVVAYRGVMLSGVPNFFFGLGYTNASWTLRMDLTYDFFVRVVRRLRRAGETTVVPRWPVGAPTSPLLDFRAGYVLRSMASFPKAGTDGPWRLRQNYARDLGSLRHGSLDDGFLEFSTVPSPACTPTS